MENVAESKNETDVSKGSNDKPLTAQKESAEAADVKIEDHIMRMEEQLKKWDERLLIIAKSEAAGMQARNDLNRRIDSLKAKHDESYAKFNELKTGGSEKFETFKTAMESAWKDMENAFQEIMNS